MGAQRNFCARYALSPFYSKILLKSYKCNHADKMSLVLRKSPLGVCYQVRHKPTYASKRFESSDIATRNSSLSAAKNKGTDQPA